MKKRSAASARSSVAMTIPSCRVDPSGWQSVHTAPIRHSPLFTRLPPLPRSIIVALFLGAPPSIYLHVADVHAMVHRRPPSTSPCVHILILQAVPQLHISSCWCVCLGAMVFAQPCGYIDRRLAFSHATRINRVQKVVPIYTHYTFTILSLCHTSVQRPLSLSLFLSFKVGVAQNRMHAERPFTIIAILNASKNKLLDTYNILYKFWGVRETTPSPLKRPTDL